MSEPVEGALHFVQGGGRTILARQHVPYPYHVTRPFQLDSAIPALATLYLQSAAGGLYSGDRFALQIAAGAGAMAHVTTQAATIVHDGRGLTASQSNRIAVCAGAFLAVTSDPFILFPGAGLAVDTEVTVAPGGAAILAEGFCTHDPAGLARPFTHLQATTVLRTADGIVRVADRGGIGGDAFQGSASPLGRYRAMGTIMIAAQNRLPDPAAIERRLAATGCLAGASPMPSSAGLAIRLLAADGGVLSRGIEAGFAFAFEALLGTAPARRRK